MTMMSLPLAMFGIGPMEMMIVGIVAVLLFGKRLPEVRAMVQRLNEEDAPVLNSMHFRRGLLTASDRHLASYFKYVEEFPTFLPPA